MRRLGKPQQVIAVSRFGSPAAREEFASYGIPIWKADLSVQEEVETLPDAALVFFLAGAKFGTAGAPELLRQANIEAPRLVAERFGSVPVVALSTGCVYPFTRIDSGGSRESDPVCPPCGYAQSCVGREEAFATVSRRGGMPCAIIRLNYSVELRYGALVDIARKVLNGEPIDLTTGYVNVIWQGDAIAHIIRSAAHTASPPFILNVTGPEALSIRSVAREFGRLFNRRPTFTAVEEKTAWLSNAEKSHRLFGAPKISADNMIEWIAAWLRSGRPTWNKPTHYEVRNGKF